MISDLLVQFARSPEWYMERHSGLNWLVSPIKFGNPAPDFSIPTPWWGAAYFDIASTSALILLYATAFIGLLWIATFIVVRYRSWSWMLVPMGALAAGGLFLVGLLHKMYYWFFEVKYANIGIFCLCITITIVLCSSFVRKNGEPKTESIYGDGSA